MPTGRLLSRSSSSKSSSTTSATLSGVAWSGVGIRTRSAENSPFSRSTGAPLMPLPPKSTPTAWVWALMLATYPDRRSMVEVRPSSRSRSEIEVRYVDAGDVDAQALEPLDEAGVAPVDVEGLRDRRRPLRRQARDDEGGARADVVGDDVGAGQHRLPPHHRV